MTQLLEHEAWTIEVERYELQNDAVWADFDRRTFLGITGGLLIAMFAAEDALAQAPGGRQRGGFGGFGGGGPKEISAWLHVGEDGSVTAFTGKTEVGQNIRTSLSQVVAEELSLPLERVALVMADTARTPTDGGTFGSRTTPSMAPQLRRAAAAMRDALLDLAAEQNKLERSGLKIDGGKVVETKTSKTFTFAELTKDQKISKVIGDGVATKPAAEWKVAGTSQPKVNGRALVTGGHQYASDVHRPGMLFGKVLRAPSFQATLVSVKTDEAEKLPGVKVVHDGNFVGVAAPTQLQAEQALAAIKAEWKEKDGQPSSVDLGRYLKEHAGAGGGRGGRPGGGRPQSRPNDEEKPTADAPEAAKGEQKISASYPVAYIAHAPLEPRAAVAEFVDGQLTVWTGTQRPFGIKSDIAGALGIGQDKVRVIVPDTGSAYGGKHTNEAPIEAARLARAAGKPVKLVWTREEEFTWAYFRPAGLIEVSATAAADGRITAWEFNNYNSGGSAIQSPYDIGGQRSQFHSSDAPLKQGSYRGLAATANIFARESAMDELAHALKMDPWEFRRKNLKDQRLRAVFEAAAKQFGWDKAKPEAGHGFGIAGGTEKGSYVAACAEVAVDREADTVRIVRLVTAFECGTIINPDHLKLQVEGAAMQGLGGALYEAIEFKNGKILNPHFAKYKTSRFRDLPVQETVLLNRPDLPSAGAGETPIVAVAPAVANAIFAATGVRLRSLPMIPKGFKAAAAAVTA